MTDILNDNKLGLCIAHHLDWKPAWNKMFWICGKGCEISYQEVM